MSFKKTKHIKRRKTDNTTIINGVRIPATPGSLYHAVLCALAEQRDKFCSWLRLVDRSQFYLRKYGGYSTWFRHCNKKQLNSYYKKIRQLATTLNTSGKNSHGYKLHRLGMCVYVFNDGVYLFTGGIFKLKPGQGYSLIFPDGRTIQTKHKGLQLSKIQYKFLLSENIIDKSCNIKNNMKIDEIKKKLKEINEIINKNITQ